MELAVAPFFFPMHQQPILKKLGFFKDEKYPISEKMYKKGFYIPSGLALNEEQILTVSIKLKKVLKEIDD